MWRFLNVLLIMLLQDTLFFKLPAQFLSFRKVSMDNFSVGWLLGPKISDLVVGIGLVIVQKTKNCC